MTADPAADPADDPAGQPRWLSDDQQRAWRRFINVVGLLPLALDRQMQAEADIPHTYFLILARLSEAPDRCLRMSDLAKALLVSPSRLSHAVARLVGRGWVSRADDPTDGRVQYAVLSNDGMSVLENIAPGHAAEVLRLVFDVLSTEQVAQLEQISTVLLGRIEADCPTTLIDGQRSLKDNADRRATLTAEQR